MWEFIVLGIFFMAIQVLLIMWGGWLLNFIFGLVSLYVAYELYNLVGSGLPLGFVMPLTIVIFTLLLWYSALSRQDQI